MSRSAGRPSKKPLQWFRMWADAVDDDKLRLLAFEDRWHFVAVLCLKAQGVLNEKNPQLIHKKVSVKLGLTEVEAEMLLKRFVTVKLTNNSWQPLNWSKRQFKSDSSTYRVQQLRKRQRNVTETSSESESESESYKDLKSATYVAPRKQDRKPDLRQEGHRAWALILGALHDTDARRQFGEGTDVHRVVGEVGGWAYLGARPAALRGQTEQLVVNAYVAMKEREHAA